MVRLAQLGALSPPTVGIVRRVELNPPRHGVGRSSGYNYPVCVPEAVAGVRW